MNQLDVVLDVVCSHYRLEVHEVVNRPRAKDIYSKARRVAIYLHHVVNSVPMANIAEQINKDKSTISYCIIRTEDERDDPQFDTLLDNLETKIVEKLNGQE